MSATVARHTAQRGDAESAKLARVLGAEPVRQTRYRLSDKQIEVLQGLLDKAQRAAARAA